MKRLLASEFLFQVFALLLSLIVVHTVYVAMVWPRAEAHLKAQAERIAAEHGTDPWTTRDGCEGWSR